MLSHHTSKLVAAPSIVQRYDSVEGRLYGDALVNRYNIFIFGVVSDSVCKAPALVQTLHYPGDGPFRGDGELHDLSRWFTNVS